MWSPHGSPGSTQGPPPLSTPPLSLVFIYFVSANSYRINPFIYLSTSSSCLIVRCFLNIYPQPCSLLFRLPLGNVCYVCVSYSTGFDCVISERGGEGPTFNNLWLGCDQGSSVMIEVFFASLM